MHELFNLSFVKKPVSILSRHTKNCDLALSIIFPHVSLDPLAANIRYFISFSSTRPSFRFALYFSPLMLQITHLHSVSPVKINGNRKVTGVLRGFDPFMNITLDNAIEEVSAEEKNELGMIVIRGNSIVMLEPLERV